MPVTSISVDNELLSSVAIVAADKARDLNHEVTPFLAEQERIRGAGQPNATSGAKWIQGMGTGTHSKATRQRTGYEEIDLSVTGVLTPLTLTPAEVIFPVAISEVEEDLNGGENQIIELAGKRTSQVMGKAKRDTEKQFILGGVTGFEDWNSLNGTDITTTNAGGYIEHAAVGSQNNSIGGFSKATYSALPGAQNQSYDGADSANANLLPGLAQILTKIKARADEDMSGISVIGSESGIENYKRMVQANERYVDADKLDALNMKLAIGGALASTSTYMPDAGTNSTASPWTFLILDFMAIYAKWSKVKRDGYFGFKDFITVSGVHNVRAAQICVRGQLWVETFASSGLLHSAETY